MPKTSSSYRSSREDEDENDTLCHLMTKPVTTSYQRLEAVVAIYGITIFVGSVVFVVFGTLDLKYPTRAAFHDVLGYKLSWVPNGLYIWAFALVAYVGILGFMYYCFGPQRKKKRKTPGKKSRIRCCKRQSRMAERVLIGFITFGLTMQIGLGIAIGTVAFTIWRSPSQVTTITVEGILNSMVGYGSELEYYGGGVNLDNFQKTHQCCGSMNATDWVTLKKMLNTVPMSCCKGDNVTETCGRGLDPANINTRGCAYSLRDDVEHYLFVVMILTAAVTGTEVLVILLFWLGLSCRWCGQDAIPTITIEDKSTEYTDVRKHSVYHANNGDVTRSDDEMSDYKPRGTPCSEYRANNLSVA